MTKLGYKLSSEEFGPTDGGYTHVCLHQVGPQQEGFIDFFEQQILPALNEAPVRTAKKAKGRR